MQEFIYFLVFIVLGALLGLGMYLDENNGNTCQCGGSWIPNGLGRLECSKCMRIKEDDSW